MKRFPSYFVVAAAYGLTSCSFIPELGKMPMPTSSRFPGKTSGEIPADISWRKFFSDPRLRSLVETSLAHNSDLRIAALNVERARAQYAISRSELFPDAFGTVDAERGRRFQDGRTNNTRRYEMTVGLTSYEADLFGRIHSQNQSALNKYFATDAARVGAQITLVSQVASQYITERALQEQIKVAQQTLDGMDQAYAIMKRRLDAGTVSDVEMSSVEVQRQTARADLAAFRQQVREVENSLVFLAGGSLPAKLPAGRPLGKQIVADVRAGVPSDLLYRRPDIRAAEFELRAANADIGAARAAFFPRVSLTANGGVASGSLSDLFTNGTGTWLFQPNISVPLFHGTFLKANLEAAEATKKIEIVNYQKAIQTAFREVADGLAGRTGLDAQIEATESLANAQKRRADLAVRRYEEGVDSYFEVLTAMLDHYAARQKVIQLRMARDLNSVMLYKALGGGW